MWIEGTPMDDPAPIEDKGAFTDDIVVPASITPDQLIADLERDRMYMAARPGFVRETTGISVAANGDSQPVGLYVFTNLKRAQEYKAWLDTGYVVNGVAFANRSYLTTYVPYTWSIIGAYDIGSVHTSQVVTRTERYSVPDVNQRPLLRARWQTLYTEAVNRGYTGVWLLYSKDADQVSIIYFDDRAAPWDRTAPDFASLDAIGKAAPLGSVFADQGWPLVFDRASWVFGVWFPFALGDQGQPPLWPNSPPFAQPYAGDGVCEPSRGETNATAPTDCTITCGNGVADANETIMNCPSDVRPFNETPGNP
ncbi:MAG TPA: hypothetical protein VK447_10185 [Myxococcaceae bacterium]|nr:hypothetical protein [Myxococcaceae bacterium]